MQDIKGNSAKWINQKKFVPGRFSWQKGYGAFSYSKSQLPSVIKYIKNQQEHHEKVHFSEEYKRILEKFQVDYDERYILKGLI